MYRNGFKFMHRRRVVALLIGIGAAVCTAHAQQLQPQTAGGMWMAGDFHQHTFFTDGGLPMRAVVTSGFNLGLHWQANSEHGGGRVTDGQGNFWDDPYYHPFNPIIGDVKTAAGSDGLQHQIMWRWQSLRDFSFPMVKGLRRQFPNQLLAQGLEWNMPGHEHCSTGIISRNARAIAQFEYLFDASDSDLTGGLSQGWGPKNTTNNHAKAVQAAAWMFAHHPMTSWIVPAHPERAASYNITHFRDLNNAAPTVAFGFEGMPGHQKETTRGSYGSGAVGGGTYGGAGVYIAKVGGLWDAMLGEGRHWWTFVSSDFHAPDGDFWPGEYAKTWTWVEDDNEDGQYSLAEVVNGLRSGNSFSVHGDLVTALDFHGTSGNQRVFMGQDLNIQKGAPLKITVRFKLPEMNNNSDPVKVDHIDLIAGEITGKVSPVLADGVTANPAYARDTNESTKVIATFTANDWTRNADGWYSVSYEVKDNSKSMYFRLRGTNLAPNTAGQTDAAGNPLLDAKGPLSGTQEAWADLWFYSNPFFVYVK